MSRRRGFTLIELLVVILILAILMAIALPLYLRAVRDSQRQTCRSNMQTIANAAQAYKVRTPGHAWPAAVSDLVFDTGDPGTAQDYDLQGYPQCPTDSVAGDADDYTITSNADGTITISCNGDTDAAFHNTPSGFTPGVSAE